MPWVQPYKRKEKEKKNVQRVPIVAQRVKNPTSLHEDACLIPGLAQWFKDPVCCKLQRRSQMWLRSGVAVAVV